MAGDVLGRQVDCPRVYDPALLVPIPRAANREALGLDPAQLPFMGSDVWNAYELSWLNAVGLPQVARARFIFPADSPNMVESKSFKLYLNSLNLHRFYTLDDLVHTLREDLARAAGTAVEVLVQPFSGMREVLEAPDGICLDKLAVSCADYEVNAELLALQEGGEAEVEEVLYTDLFRSLCPVTGQPDWATVLISYRGPAIDHAALLRYLVSYREHGDFHENCAERIYCDIQQRCQPRYLGVEANFLRRGGLDINPLRSTSDDINPVNLPRYNRQ